MKYVLLIISAIISLLTLLVGSIYFNRLTLNYNSEGSFFSMKENIVYTEQALDVFGLLTILGAVLSTLIIFGTIRYFRNVKDN